MSGRLTQGVKSHRSPKSGCWKNVDTSRFWTRKPTFCNNHTYHFHVSELLNLSFGCSGGCQKKVITFGHPLGIIMTCRVVMSAPSSQRSSTSRQGAHLQHPRPGVPGMSSSTKCRNTDTRCRLLIRQDVGKIGFRQISLNICILYQK